MMHARQEFTPVKAVLSVTESLYFDISGGKMSMIPIARPLLGSGEQGAVLRVLASGQLAQGEHVAAFERRFAQVCHVREAVAVSSGTAALHLSLLAHGIGPGDEVITTALSFAATANVILLVGAPPVFVDIEPDTYTLDPSLVETALTPPHQSDCAGSDEQIQVVVNAVRKSALLGVTHA